MHRTGRARLAIVALVLALIVSNLWWAYRLLDAGVSHTHLGMSLDQSQAALAQALHLLPAAAKSDISREQLIEAARRAAKGDEPFERDGFVWVGQLGLRFDKQNRLVEVATSGSVP